MVSTRPTCSVTSPSSPICHSSTASHSQRHQVSSLLPEGPMLKLIGAAPKVAALASPAPPTAPFPLPFMPPDIVCSPASYPLHSEPLLTTQPWYHNIPNNPHFCKCPTSFLSTSVVLFLLLFFCAHPKTRPSPPSRCPPIQTTIFIHARIVACLSFAHLLLAGSSPTETADPVTSQAKSTLPVPGLVSLSVDLNKRIGSGGYGSVYLSVLNAQRVAIKLPSGKAQNIDFLKEAELHRDLRHCNIILFIDTVSVDDKIGLVTMFAGCGSLKRAITLDGGTGSILDWSTKTRISKEIAHALEYLHSKDIIHRDAKSANVLLDEHLKVKLCDFGFAIRVDKVNLTGDVSSDAMTPVGTRRWMAPELLHGIPTYSPASDMYAYGMILWEMAANCTLPFQQLVENKEVADYVLAGGRETIPSNTPADYRRRLEQCWHQDPGMRPRAKELFHVEIEGYESLARDGESEISGSTSEVDKSRNWVPANDSSSAETAVVVQQALSLMPAFDWSPWPCSDSLSYPDTLSCEDEWQLV